MIIKFSFSNIFSFKDKQEVSFEPEPLKELDEHLIRPNKYGKSESFLRTLAIYGHNSHGKSNLIKTFEVFISVIKNSFKEPHVLKSIEPFALNTSTNDKASYFEITVIADEVKYRYGFEATASKIICEWLYYAPFSVKESNLFMRIGQEFRISKLWNKESDSKVESQSLPFAISNVLLFSVLIAQQNERVAKIAEVLNSIVVLRDINSTELISKAASIFSDQIYALKVQSFIDDADIGFKTIYNKIENKVNGPKDLDQGFLKNMVYDRGIEKFELFTYHKIYDENHVEKKVIEFDFLKKESEGTIKFFVLVSFLVFAIKNKLLVIVDELDSKFHSDLLNLIISKFHNKEINDSEAQLIFTSHNTVLLDKKLRRDQVLFIEKNDYGESSLRPMHSKNTPIRIDASIEKDYRKGKLGGVSKKMRNNDPNQISLFD